MIYIVRKLVWFIRERNY